MKTYHAIAHKQLMYISVEDCVGVHITISVIFSNVTSFIRLLIAFNPRQGLWETNFLLNHRDIFMQIDTAYVYSAF